MNGLSSLQESGLKKIGFFYCPGEQGLPEFAVSGCLRHWNRVFDALSEADRSDILLLLRVFGWLPSRWVGWILGWMEKKKSQREYLPAALEKIRIGVRGLVFSLYYTEIKIGS